MHFIPRMDSWTLGDRLEKKGQSETHTHTHETGTVSPSQMHLSGLPVHSALHPTYFAFHHFRPWDKVQTESPLASVRLPFPWLVSPTEPDISSPAPPLHSNP